MNPWRRTYLGAMGNKVLCFLGETNLRQPDFSYSCYRQSLETFLSGQWDHSTVCSTALRKHSYSLADLHFVGVSHCCNDERLTRSHVLSVSYREKWLCWTGRCIQAWEQLGLCSLVPLQMRRSRPCHVHNTLLSDNVVSSLAFLVAPPSPSYGHHCLHHRTTTQTQYAIMRCSDPRYWIDPPCWGYT